MRPCIIRVAFITGKTLDKEHMGETLLVTQAERGT